MGLFDLFSSKPQPAGNSAPQSGTGQAITHLSSDTFEWFVTSASTPVLVDFWAEWCGPCKQITPILNDIARDYAGQIAIAKINVDDFGDIAAHFNVMSIPTMILFRNGIEAHRIIGAMPKERLLRELSLTPLTAPIATTAPTQRTFPFETLLARQPTPDSVPGTEQWMDLLRKVVP
jgi:thioredoxin 1